MNRIISILERSFWKMGNIKSKYQKVATNIFEYIGGKENQVNLYNCMTRLRIKILNKELVDIEKIKSLDIVKGINWNGDELQIIIGGEVYKVKEECLKILDSKETAFNKGKNGALLTKDRTSISKKIMPAITAIVFPTIPILIGGGIIGGLQSILVISGVLHTKSCSWAISSWFKYVKCNYVCRFQSWTWNDWSNILSIYSTLFKRRYILSIVFSIGFDK